MSGSKTGAASWRWNDVFQKQCTTAETSRDLAVPVTALEHAPMAQLYDQFFFEGTVAELPLKLLNCGDSDDSDESDSDSDVDESQPDKLLPNVKYWFVKVVKMAGYFFEVEYLGVKNIKEEDLKRIRKWVHKTDLRPIAHYADLDALPRPPPELKEFLIKDFDIVKITETLYQQILGKLTVNLMADLAFQWSLLTDLKDGSMIEIPDPRLVNRMVPAYVFRFLGGRVEVVPWDVPFFESVWYHIKSPVIRPIGWSKAAGAAVFEPSMSPGPVSPEKLGVQLFDPAKLGLAKGMCFEVINPLKLDEIVAAAVVDVLKNGFFTCKIISKIHEEDLKQYAGGRNEFHLHLTSPNIFPCGTCKNNKVEIVPPEDFTGGQFDWAMYLAIIGNSPLPIPAKDEDAGDQASLDLKKGMYLEAVDSNKTQLVCPARIVSVLRGYAVRVRFMGWGKDFDQWKPIQSAEIFPAGWCKLVSYPLTLPGSAEVELPLPKESEKTLIQAKLASHKKVDDSNLKQPAHSKMQLSNSKELKQPGNTKMPPSSSEDLKKPGNSKMPPSNKDVQQPGSIKKPPSKDLKQKEKKSASVKNDAVSIVKKDGNASKTTAAKEQAAMKTVHTKKASEVHVKKRDRSSSHSEIDLLFEDEPEPRSKGRKGIPKKNAGDSIVSGLDSPEQKKPSKRSGSLPKRNDEAPVIDLEGSDEQKAGRTRRSRQRTKFFGNNVDKSKF